MILRSPKWIFLSVVCAMLLWAGWVSWRIPLRQEDELGGAYVSTPAPDFTWPSWFDGSYAKHAEKYLGEKAAFREWLIRFRNQLDFTLYRHAHAEDVFIAKNDDLMRPTELYEINGHYGLPDEEWQRNMNDLVYAQRYLDSLGIPLVIAITPAKAHFNRENIPANRVNTDPHEAFYQVFLRKAAEAGVKRIVDFNGLFLQWKNKTPYPLYCRTGIHWTQYGAMLAMDSLMSYARTVTGKRLPRLRWSSIIETNEPRDNEKDVLNSLNLLVPIPAGKLGYPVLLPADSSEYKPNMLVIGDSYYHALLYTKVHSAISDPRSDFSYYFRENWSDSHPGDLRAPVLPDDLKGRDLVIMFYSPANLFQPFWDFPRKLRETAGAN